jgi:hypothetical protein
MAFERTCLIRNVSGRTGNGTDNLSRGGLKMSKEGKFLVYCLETYRTAKNITGRQAITIFKQYGVSDYIMSCYEALHTTGTNYIIEDIDLFIEAHQSNS